MFGTWSPPMVNLIVMVTVWPLTLVEMVCGCLFIAAHHFLTRRAGNTVWLSNVNRFTRIRTINCTVTDHSEQFAIDQSDCIIDSGFTRRIIETVHNDASSEQVPNNFTGQGETVV